MLCAVSVVGVAALGGAWAAKAWTHRIGAGQNPVCGQPLCSLSMVDFRDATWRPSGWFLDGHNPYDTADYLAHFPNSLDYPTYLPGHLVLWSPLGSVDWSTAVVLDIAINLLVVLAVGTWTGLTALRSLRPHGRLAAVDGVTAACAMTALLLITRPLTLGVFLGQPSVVYALLAVPAVLTRRRIPAILLVAIVCLKPQAGIAVIVVLLARRQWRRAAAGVALAGVVSLAAVPVLAGGLGRIGGFVTGVRDNVRTASSIRSSEWLAERIDIAGALDHLGLRPSTAATAAIIVAGLVLAYFVVGHLTPVFPFTATLLGFGVVTIAIYHNAYDAVWLIPLCVLSGVELFGTPDRRLLHAVPGWLLIFFGAGFAHYYIIDRLGSGLPDASIWLMRASLCLGAVWLATVVWSADRPSRPDSTGAEPPPGHAADDPVHGSPPQAGSGNDATGADG